MVEKELWRVASHRSISDIVPSHTKPLMTARWFAAESNAVQYANERIRKGDHTVAIAHYVLASAKTLEDKSDA